MSAKVIEKKLGKELLDILNAVDNDKAIEILDKLLENFTTCSILCEEICSIESVASVTRDLANLIIHARECKATDILLKIRQLDGFKFLLRIHEHINEPLKVMNDDELCDLNIVIFNGLTFRSMKNHLKTIPLVRKLNNEITTTIKISQEPILNPDEISVLIGRTLDELEKQIPRCKDAFKLLMKNQEKFMKNFNSYYELFQIKGDPVVFVTSYFEDILTDEQMKAKMRKNLTLKLQVKKILIHLRDNVSKQKIPKEIVHILDKIIEDL